MNEATTSQRFDARDLLRDWANSADEWVRYIVRHVLSAGSTLDGDQQVEAYALFRQEKAFDERLLPEEEPLVTLEREDEAVDSLTITSLSEVAGVNALIEGGAFEPHEGMTILFGENGTGKTGYSRIFKALASSRTADVILGDIESDEQTAPSALVGYALGETSKTYSWTGQMGVAPFSRLSIFDSPSVSLHVDDDLEYVYVPAALSLFNHVIAGIKSVKNQIDQAAKDLRSSSAVTVSRFPRGATVYPLIETLGASTDLEQLREAADSDPDVDERISKLRRTVAALEANTLGSEIKVQQRRESILTQIVAAAKAVADFDIDAYQLELAKLAELRADYDALRTELFDAADLPAEPDETWELFVQSGDGYRSHLETLGLHDDNRCLYCRQVLNERAQSLVGKYSEYLQDRISAEIAASEARLVALVEPITSTTVTDASTFADEYAMAEEKPAFYSELDRTLSTLSRLRDRIGSFDAIEPSLTETAEEDSVLLEDALKDTGGALADLRQQAVTRGETLATKKTELVELEAAAELAKSWPLIESHVRNAKEADRLELLAKPMSGLLRAVTGLAKTASDQMINESFDTLFAEECSALRAPDLQVEFVGRQGRAQRRKVLSGQHKPSKVLSEGEQKVLAIADFLAEARLTGLAAPVIFDDPVSSLDHRRVSEVAQRIAALSESTQVIVFTHDIFFASTLLMLMEESRRCSYFQVTDEDGNGRITRATGPRWDSLSSLRANINQTIQTANSEEGDARAALVRTGYDWIRAWCEVFTETELLQGVTRRYQPNVRMTSLPKIRTEALPAAIEVVNRVFEEACRYIDGHSQPLPSLNVRPTLTGLEAHWDELQQARSAYRAAAQ